MKIACGFLLLLLGSALPAPVPEAKESNEHLMYPYGTAVGDMKTPKDDDGTSPKINIAKNFTFYSIPFRSLYVNNNGVISFAVPVPEFTPKAIPLVDGKHFVAPYWGDVNNILGGDVFYREETSPEILDRLTKDINTYFPEIPFTATWAFIATWHGVAYFGSVSKKANTFQAILITDEQTSFIMLNYGEIQWTTGAASGGDRKTGLGGTPAQAGFNSGDDKNYYSIPGSRTPQIINITHTSNVHVPGRWVFQVDEFKVTGVPKELLPPAKEEEKGNGHEEQGQQSNEPHEATRNPPEEEESHVVQGNEVTSEVHGQEQNEEREPVPSGNVREEEESQASQESEVHPEAEEQEEKEEMEPVPSGNLPQEEESQVSQDNEVNPEAEEQEEKEEMEPVPSGNLEEKEESQVSQDNEVNPEAVEQEEKEEMEPVLSGNLEEKEESQVSQDNEVNPEAVEQEEKEEMEPVPSGNLEEKEESQVDQGFGNPEEEGQQKEGEDGGVSVGDLTDHPVQEPQLNYDSEESEESKESKESEESEECEW